jgi:hypothetical protein
MNRDTDGNGIVDQAIGWSTYDNADVIKKSPENTYLGVKQMMAYLVAADMFENLYISPEEAGELKDIKDVKDGTGVGYETGKVQNKILRLNQAAKYRAEAQKIINTLNKAFLQYGYIPCSLDTTFEGWAQHSIVIGEGLFLPGLVGFESPILKEILPALKTSYEKAYQLSKTDYGIKLSSDEGGTWFSKIMVMDNVAAKWYNINNNNVSYTYHWNKNNHYAYNDGINADGKTAWIGFWYPRGVSVIAYFLLEKNIQEIQISNYK